MNVAIAHFISEESITSAKIVAVKQFNSGASPVSIFIVSKNVLSEFIKQYFINFLFIRGTRGLIEAIYQAIFQAIVLTFLWELQNTNKEKIN